MQAIIWGFIAEKSGPGKEKTFLPPAAGSLIRIRVDPYAGLVILNAAQRSEGSGSRSRETSRSMPRSFG